MAKTQPQFQPSLYGLPDNYLALDESDRREERLKVSRSWYDIENHPDVVVLDQDKFVNWIRLFVDWYLKPAVCNRSVYSMPDPRNKYGMVRAIGAPPKETGEPSKSIISAVRSFSKTVTVIHQVVLGSVIARPDLGVVISEFNLTRTKEELQTISRQIKKNVRIHRDFGGAGKLYPTNRDRDHSWNSTELELLNGSFIKGVPIGAAHRGRHPKMGVIDDPEKDKKKSMNPQWRKEFFEWYFRVWMPQFRIGGLSIWVGTEVGVLSCMRLAMRGITEDGDQRDPRFDDHHKGHFRIIERADDGTLKSNWPEFMSVEAYEAKARTMGLAARAAEVDCAAIIDGEHVFEFHPHKHKYMKCVDRKGDADESYYMLDCQTGETIPWERFLSSLAICGANDVADSVSPDADPAVCIIIGVDKAGTVFVLDAWWKQTLVEESVPMAFTMAEEWACAYMGWETSALQRIVYRWANKLAGERRQKGLHAPLVVPVKNTCNVGDKINRIVGAVSPLMVHSEIRFLGTDPMTTSDGKVHYPAPCKRKRAHNDLVNTIITFTTEGCGGFIDLPDTLEMALRVAGARRGKEPASEEITTEEQIAAWERVGLTVNRATIPESMWPASWHQEANDRPVVSSIPQGREYDPYE